MLKRLFRKPKESADVVVTLDQLNETLKVLEKKESLLSKKVEDELRNATAYSKQKNRRAAIQCLKRKKTYEQQIEQLCNFQLRIHDQMIMLESAKATTETVSALRTGAATMKAIQKATNITDVDKTMDEINEQVDNMRQVQDILAAPVAGVDFDEDDLVDELNRLEEEFGPAIVAPAPPVHVPAPAGRRPAQRQKHSDEVDELAALQAEMAL